MRFDGETFDGPQDGARLRTQLERVRALMADGRPRTLRQIAGAVGGSEASVSARLRDLRKPRHGAWLVTRARLSGGLWAYAVTRPTGQMQIAGT